MGIQYSGRNPTQNTAHQQRHSALAAPWQGVSEIPVLIVAIYRKSSVKYCDVDGMLAQ